MPPAQADGVLFRNLTGPANGTRRPLRDFGGPHPSEGQAELGRLPQRCLTDRTPELESPLSR